MARGIDKISDSIMGGVIAISMLVFGVVFILELLELADFQGDAEDTEEAEYATLESLVDLSVYALVFGGAVGVLVGVWKAVS